MVEYYELEICGIKRKLPLRAVSKKTKIANFSILGDVELVKKTSLALAERLGAFDFDFLVGPEVKVVPLIHEVSRNMGKKRYIICRKSFKPYMVSPKILKPLPHFPKHTKPLVIGGTDIKRIIKKKVVILDDVVSTGVTIRMMKKLMEEIRAKVVAIACVIKQGEQFDEFDNLIYLEKLPIFKD